MELLITDIAFIVIAAAVLGYLSKLLKQPLIMAYIIAGFIIGPFGFNFIGSENTVLSVSELGITFLLFLVGLELDLKKLKEVGKVVVMTSLMQVVLTSSITLLISYFMGFSLIESFYIAIALSFTSTLIIVKHYSDKKEINTLHGRILIGVLVIEDIIAILLISVLPTLDTFNFSAIGIAALSGIALMGLAFVLSRFVLGRVIDYSAKDPELLFLSSLAVCFVFGYVATLMGFSMTIGAFIAGVILANLPYSFDIMGKVKALTSFFSALFFVSLGMRIVPSTLPGILLPLLVLIAVAIVIKPLIGFLLVYSMGYHKKTAYVTGISLGNVSEFSLILVAQGIALGHLHSDIFSLIISLTVITMAMSTYVLRNVNSNFHKYEKYMQYVDRLFNRKKEQPLDEKSRSFDDINVVINGYANLEGSILERFMSANKKVLVVDNDPDVVRKLRELKIPTMYGELAEQEIFECIDMKKVEIVMSTVSEYNDNMKIVKSVREANNKAIIIVSAEHVSDSFELYNAGADYVVIPHVEGARQTAILIEDFYKDMSKVLPNKIKHIEQLRKKQSMQDEIHAGNGSFFTDIDNFLKETGKVFSEGNHRSSKAGQDYLHISAKKEAEKKQENAIDINKLIEESGNGKARQEA